MAFVLCPLLFGFFVLNVEYRILNWMIAVNLFKFSCMKLFLLFSFFVLVSSCGKTQTTQNKTPKPLYQSTGKEGKIKGTVNFTGNVQSPGKIDMNSDAACVSKNPNATLESLKVKNGKLENVIVFIKDGITADGKKLSELSFQTPDSEMKLDQSGCVYVPRVLALQTNQKLTIHNSDQTIHTTQAASQKNPSWFTTQQIDSAPVVKTFTEPETVIPLKCSQHGWMAAYIAVFETPFFAVTKEDGAFEIKGVPPGEYTLAAWHEKGTAKGTEKTIQVKVNENGEASADFSFDDKQTQPLIVSLIFSSPLELAMPGCN